MLKFGVSACRIFRPNSEHPPEGRGPCTHSHSGGVPAHLTLDKKDGKITHLEDAHHPAPALSYGCYRNLQSDDSKRIREWER
jgi:hypothetical protein